jgi:TonB family protein
MFLRLSRYLLLCLVLLNFGSALAQESTRKLKNKVVPLYPELARQLGIAGTVKLDVHIGRDGKITAVTVKGGHPVLAEAAERAVHKWRYEAGSEETITVELNFTRQQ